MSVIVRVTISGGLITALPLMVGIAVYWKKVWKKFSEKLPFSECQKLESKQLYNEGQENEFEENQLELRGKQPLNEEDSMVFTLPEMKKATKNFSQKIGEGALGEVFFGKLPNGKGIAVKVLSPETKRFLTDWFLTEIDLLSRVHHKNLVSLVGYCIDQSGKRMLIYDHMSEQSLRDHLYGRTAGVSKLNWKTRLKIAIDAAEGLQYLHVCCTPMIIHRDVHTSNILLDGNLNGKLCNFGLSMMTMDPKAPIDTAVVGTKGYGDPEYICSGQLTQKSDVYDFGMVLLEIICGRRPLDTSLRSEEQKIAPWVKGHVGINENPRKIEKIIDKNMDGKYDMKSISSVAKVALRCVETQSSSRPNIS